MVPNRVEEKQLWTHGLQTVVGMDEVGRGSWAGPLTVGAVVIPKDRRIYKVRDSKQIPEKKRDALCVKIKNWCVTWSVGHASSDECDQLGMSAAQKLAAKRAVVSLGVRPDAYLLDGKWSFIEHPVVRTLVKGDTRCLSIAAASIIAKVTRDTLMRQYAVQYPDFDFSNNKGYPSPKHRKALRQLGATEIHRTSWSFMKSISKLG